MFKKKENKVEQKLQTTINKSTSTVQTKQTVTTYNQVTTRTQTSSSSEFTYKVNNNNNILPTFPSISTDATPFKSTYVSPYRSQNVSSVFQLPTTSTSTSNRTNLPISRSTTNIPKSITTNPPPVRSASVSSSVGIPTYDTKGSKRGKVLIINNIKFRDKEERKGAQLDQKSLSKMFNKFKFSVTTRTDLTRSGMENEVKKFAKDSSLKTYNMAVLVIMSHGTMLGNTSTVTQIAGIDNQLLLVENILSIFADDLAHLQGKPKIFIFQCCRGETESISTDATPFKRNSDMLIAFSTLPGFVSYRNPEKGSWYIQTLCEIFEKHSHEWDIESMLKKVDEVMSLQNNTNRQQVSCYEARGFKRCFLYQS